MYVSVDVVNKDVKESFVELVLTVIQTATNVYAITCLLAIPIYCACHVSCPL